MSMRIHLSRPDIGEQEIEAVSDVLRSDHLSFGPKLPEFERAFAEYVGTQRAVAVNSGTSGLFLSLTSLGIGPGDEVITTPFTFIASATTIMMTGAKPVFADISPENLNLDPHQFESHITPRTKAVVPVEVFGNPAGVDEICQVAQGHGLPVVEDSCEALGTHLNGKMTGTLGQLSVFAFYPNKQITTGEGGMILTDQDDLADLCLSLRNQGRSSRASWLCHERLGYNFRLSEINCALGIVQLSRIEEFVQKRARVVREYERHLSDQEHLILPAPPANCRMSWFVYVVRLTDEFERGDRDALLDDLSSQGIQVSNYFPPVHLQPFMVQRFNYRPGDFPITEGVSERTIALPFHNNLSDADIHSVSQALKKSVRTLLKRRPRTSVAL